MCEAEVQFNFLKAFVYIGTNEISSILLYKAFKVFYHFYALGLKRGWQYNTYNSLKFRLPDILKDIMKIYNLYIFSPDICVFETWAVL